MENRDGYKKKPKSFLSCLVRGFFFFFLSILWYCKFDQNFKIRSKLSWIFTIKNKIKNFPFFLGWNKQNFFCQNKKNCYLVFKRDKYCKWKSISPAVVKGYVILDEENRTYAGSAEENGFWLCTILTHVAVAGERRSSQPLCTCRKEKSVINMI